MELTEPATFQDESSDWLIVHRPISRIGSAVVLRTTPWIACGPKCLVAASPPNTIVMLELGSEYGISFPPVMQTCNVDEGGFVSKGAICPFPVNRLTVPFI